MAFTIFAYTDYRQALSDYYQCEKEQNPNFSHRYIAHQIGFSSGFFSQILKGKSNISQERIPKFTKLLKLNKKESDYFEVLVNYNQAKDFDTQKRLFEKLISLNKNDIKPLSLDHYTFYNKWYYSAVREALDCIHFKDDYQTLASKIHPSITEKQAKEAIHLLKQLNLIKKDRYGYYHKTDAFIKAGSEEHSFMLKNFVINMMDLARESIDTLDKDERNLSWQTLSIKKEQYPEIIEEIRAFRKKLMTIAEKTDDTDSVYQINFQIFPLTK